MSKYEMVRRYYDLGYWSLKRVRDAVAKGWITAAQFEEITGKTYEEIGGYQDDE